MADLDAATLDDVVEFFRTYYVPSNAVLTVAGGLAPERTLEAVERWFGEIPRGAPTPHRTSHAPHPRPAMTCLRYAMQESISSWKKTRSTNASAPSRYLSASTFGQSRSTTTLGCDALMHLRSDARSSISA